MTSIFKSSYHSTHISHNTSKNAVYTPVRLIQCLFFSNQSKNVLNLNEKLYYIRGKMQNYNLYNQVWVPVSTVADLMYDFDFFPQIVRKKLDYVISKGLFLFVFYFLGFQQ